jgi:hypothetical protein
MANHCFSLGILMVEKTLTASAISHVIKPRLIYTPVH